MAWSQENNIRFDRNLNSFYILLQSDSSINLFPQNSVFNFRSKLNKQYNLNDDWVVALCDLELYLSDTYLSENNLYIFCDIIAETQVGNTDEQMLRRVPIRKSDVSQDWLKTNFQTLYYIPLKTTTLTEIGIRIEQSAQTLAARKDKPTSLLLHFKKLYNGSQQ